LTGKVITEKSAAVIYPAKHFVFTESRISQAIRLIEEELEERLTKLRHENQLYAQRLEQRTRYDLEMIEELGYCSGIENYSRYFDGRKPGDRPYVLLDYFPKDFLMFIDESHVTIPQIRGMYGGDKSRKDNLIKYGFRLESAYDNRPLFFSEFEQFLNKNRVIYVSATPGSYELSHSEQITEMIVRPTGLIDPEVIVKPTENQIDDLISLIRQQAEHGERTLVTTLTKRMAEDLTDYLLNVGLRVRYLHSDIETLERVEILRDLRLGKFDTLIGINLLREGLDLPEVSLVTILDADKEGFLRSETSLIQTIGRASRNVSGRVILYADEITESMRRALDETERRRFLQLKYNEEHGITPKTISKRIRAPISEMTKTEIELDSIMLESPEDINIFEYLTNPINNPFSRLIAILSLSLSKRKDDLRIKKVSIRYLFQINSWIKKAFKNASKVNHPVIIFQGTEDKLVSPKGVKELYENLTSKDKTFIELDGAYHSLYSDSAMIEQKGWKKLKEWILKH